MTDAALKRKLRKRIEKVADMSSYACGFDGPMRDLFFYEKDLVEWIMSEIKRARQEGKAR